MTYDRRWPDNWASTAYCIAFKFDKYEREVFYDRVWSRAEANKWIAWHHNRFHVVLYMIKVKKRATDNV